MESRMNGAAELGDAVRWAARAHEGQTRKGTGLPYVSHPIAVMALVLEHGGTFDQAIAAVLHDVVEDCGVTVQEIEARYGPDVAMMVEECTDGVPDESGRKPDWQTRKQDYLHGLSGKDQRALMVVLADKVHNAESIVRDLYGLAGLGVFDRFTAGAHGTAWYYGSLAAWFQCNAFVLPNCPPALIKRLVSAAGEIDRASRRAAFGPAA